MNCDGSEECLAKKHPETPCWELANEIGDYRRFCSICQDCIVFVLKKNIAVLSDKQKKSILQKKVECSLAA
jgi:hypothetical protein